MPEDAHAPLTEAEIALYEHAAKNLEVGSPYRVRRLLAEIREQRRLLRAMDRETTVCGFCYQEARRQGHTDKCEVGRYVAACEGKSKEQGMKPLDPEIKAMRALQRAIRMTPVEARQRVLEWLVAHECRLPWVTLPSVHASACEGKEQP